MTEHHSIPKDATAADLRAAIAHWESAPKAGVSGYYVDALYRYWKRKGPSFSEFGIQQYEHVRRLLETADGNDTEPAQQATPKDSS